MTGQQLQQFNFGGLKTTWKPKPLLTIKQTAQSQTACTHFEWVIFSALTRKNLDIYSKGTFEYLFQGIYLASLLRRIWIFIFKSLLKYWWILNLMKGVKMSLVIVEGTFERWILSFHDYSNNKYLSFDEQLYAYLQKFYLSNVPLSQRIGHNTCSCLS